MEFRVFANQVRRLAVPSFVFVLRPGGCSLLTLFSNESSLNRCSLFFSILDAVSSFHLVAALKSGPNGQLGNCSAPNWFKRETICVFF